MISTANLARAEENELRRELAENVEKDNLINLLVTFENEVRKVISELRII